MKFVNLSTENEAAAFARSAALKLRDDRKLICVGEIEGGNYLALRWNTGHVLVVQIGEEFVPSVYSSRELIGGDVGTQAAWAPTYDELVERDRRLERYQAALNNIASSDCAYARNVARRALAQSPQ